MDSAVLSHGPEAPGQSASAPLFHAATVRTLLVDVSYKFSPHGTAWTSDATSCTGSLLDSCQYARMPIDQQVKHADRINISATVQVLQLLKKDLHACPLGSVIALFCLISSVVICASGDKSW